MGVPVGSKRETEKGGATLRSCGWSEPANAVLTFLISAVSTSSAIMGDCDGLLQPKPCFVFFFKASSLEAKQVV